MSAKVWVLGDAVVDLLPAEGGLLQPCPGGAPANVAVGIARLGGESAFIGRVGGDPFGQMLMQTLAAEGVDVRYMICDEQRRTSTVLVALGDEGERTFTFMVRPGADLFLSVQDLPPFAAGAVALGGLLRRRNAARGRRIYQLRSQYSRRSLAGRGESAPLSAAGAGPGRRGEAFG